MPYNPTHRRNLSAPNTPVNNHHNPHPSGTTIQEISTHFSRLYQNHKACTLLQPSSIMDKLSILQPTTTRPFNETPTSMVLTKSQSQRTSGPTSIILTKSQSQRTSGGARNRGYHYTAGYLNNEPKEQEESIKETIVINNSKKPAMNVNGCGKFIPENQEMRKLQHGLEVKMQTLVSSGINKGIRRSCGYVEMADFLAYNGVKVVSTDMPSFMQIHAVDVTRKTYDSLEKFTAKTLALTLKKEFDGTYGPSWHCIVGLSFGSFVTHSVGGFLYFSMDQKLFVLLFKTSVRKAH
uniref:uncharacterized protein LOC122589892 n=1 Tax=Erigeron canadensis TaxID=72917 RepID=UPI001CB94BA9|nr:uncharacterized protein LOC122589892 [Erigeron canadensis]